VGLNYEMPFDKLQKVNEVVKAYVCLHLVQSGCEFALTAECVAMVCFKNHTQEGAQ